MMDAHMKEALCRTKKHLVRHLEDLNDEIDRDDGRIKDHMVVDGLKDCVKTLCRIKELLGGAESETQDGTTEDSESSEPERPSAVSALR